MRPEGAELRRQAAKRIETKQRLVMSLAYFGDNRW